MDDGSEDVSIEATEGRAEAPREGDEVDGLPEGIPVWTVGAEDGDRVPENHGSEDISTEETEGRAKPARKVRKSTDCQRECRSG
jgi:hypothetical protein